MPYIGFQKIFSYKTVAYFVHIFSQRIGAIKTGIGRVFDNNVCPANSVAGKDVSESIGPGRHAGYMQGAVGV